MQLRKRCYKN